MIKIATTAYDKEEIELQDGTEVVLKPLNLVNLRRFSTRLRQMDKEREEAKETGEESRDEAEDRELNGMIELAGICLERALFDEKTEEGKSKEERKKQWREFLEDALDMPTIDKVLEVCGGVSKPDPNLLMAALEMARKEQEDGKTSTS